MTSNRPFLSNFLAAFRAHSATLPKAAPSIGSASTSTNSKWAASSYAGPTAQSQPMSTLSSPRPINHPQKVGGTAATQTGRSTSPGPLPATTFSPPLQHNVSPLTHGTRPASTTPKSERPNPYAPPQEPRRVPGTPHSSANMNIPASTSPGAVGRRRGSDSSSEGGFRDVATSRGGEKWYIGGRTAGGEERYYKLSMVRRERSADRLSADRLSL